MRINGQGLDAKFWGFIILAALFVGTFGCFGIAAAAQAASTERTGIISVSDTLRQIDPPSSKVRNGVMTERIRNGGVMPESAVVAEAVR
jgi:hypothetical protein